MEKDGKVNGKIFLIWLHDNCATPHGKVFPSLKDLFVAGMCLGQWEIHQV